MTRANSFALTRTSLMAISVVSVVASAAPGEDVDWERHLIDGVQLTGNHDMRYLNADPSVRVTVEGRPQEEAGKLVNGQYGSSGIRWARGQKIAILIDMKAGRLLSGIAMTKQGDISSLRIASTLDGQLWRLIPAERLTDAGGLVAANLALPARHLRIDGTAAGENGVHILDIVAYGEKQVDVPMVGGIYPSFFPPAAGEEIELRAVVRNARDELATALAVRFVQTAPKHEVLGEQAIDRIGPCSARMASIPWKPSSTEPHRIEVEVAVQGREKATARETIPVVHRRVYFSNWCPLDNDRLRYTNVYTTVGGGYETFMANLRGRMGLYAGHASPTGVGASKTQGVSADRLHDHYTSLVMGRYRDGADIDEFASSTIHSGVSEALRKVGQDRGGRFIVPWLIGLFDENVANAFEYADLVFVETYLNWQHPTVDPWIHHQYRLSLDRKIDSARKWSMLEKQVVALGCFYSDTICVPTTVADIEREVQYLRLRGPEMPGVCYYGGYERGERSTFNVDLEELSYKYFIAPVIMFDGPWEVKNSVLHATVWNTGGMTARGIVVAAVDASSEDRLGQATVAVLAPGSKKSIRVELPTVPPHLAAGILESPHYTALNPKTLELMPERQMRGVPVRVSWTPLREKGRLARDDALEVVSRENGEVIRQIADIAAKANWDGATHHLPDVPTADLVPGGYRVRIVGGPEKLIKVSVPLEITPSNAVFFVRQVNGKPWTGDPRQIVLGRGDTFEVCWDMGAWQLSGDAAICVSAPDGDRADPGPSVRASLLRVAPLIRNRRDNPFKSGRCTWNSAFQMSDGVPVSEPGEAEPARPGAWRLWLSDEDPPTTPIPWVPVITIRVEQR